MFKDFVKVIFSGSIELIMFKSLEPTVDASFDNIFNEFQSSVILFIEVKYFFISSNIYFPDFKFNAA